MKRFILLVLAMGFSILMTTAQSSYKLTTSKNLIKGTSSMHDWRCIIEKQTGDAEINTTGKLEIKSLFVRFDAKSIKSLKENGSYYDEGMDKNTYKALNVEVYPEIVFTLKNISNVKTVGNTSNLTVLGDLTVAGKTKTLSFPGKAIVNGNNITFTCTTKFKMTLFDIQPPTALFGTIKTGDEIILDINSTFTKL